MTLVQAIRKKAKDLGFEVCQFTAAELPETVGRQLEQSIAAGHHGTMDWLATTRQRRTTPGAMWPEAKTAILLGMNYGPLVDPLEILKMRKKAAISVYARNRDYHGMIKGRLKQIAGWIASKTGENVKVFVDTAPLMEKPLAQQAGLGWQGKHTNLVSREFGSWLFLGVILTAAVLETDAPETDHCGSCRACLDICPTDAFPAPYQLDARRCISYLTIEHKGPIPLKLREAVGNRIFGCDDCLAVCPWNKYARETRETKLAARDDLLEPDLADLARLDDAAFRKKFSASPVKRIGRDRFLRNVLTGIGNSGDGRLAKTASRHLDDPNAVVRGAAIWALGRLSERKAFHAMRKQAEPNEPDNQVLREWAWAAGDAEDRN